MSRSSGAARPMAHAATHAPRRSTSSCSVCASEDLRGLFARQGYTVFRCSRCGLRLLQPQPDQAVLDSLYARGYFLADATPESQAALRRLKAATARLYLDLIGRDGSGSRLLEIGCGGGEFLIEARGRGFEVRGLEVSPDSVAVANRRLGDDCVSLGALETTPLPESSFHVVALFDVIEHVRDPRGFLERVCRALMEGGTVAIVTPSVESWPARLLGRHWMEYKLEHLHYFGPESLRRLLGEVGFGGVRITPVRKVLSLDYVARHFERFPVPLLTSLVRLARRLAPPVLAARSLRVAAGGILALATKA